MVAVLLTACAPSPSPGSSAQPGSQPGSQPSPQPGGPPGRGSRGDDPAPDPAPSDPVADAFVAAHNHFRANVSPAADPPLPPVAWSPELAAEAQAWADRCNFEHSETDHGENLSARTNATDPRETVEAWASEAEHFDHRKNRCASGAVCGHYTQLVWRASTKIGCGVARCSSNSPFGGGAWVLTVCNYDPAGNWRGEKPY